ncbi:glycoprotein 96-92 [Trypanosoma grayi]|uniref:glycoprotein 96-92 n=1 Tax=Trypanosoma grayi TaxID=71804 RepID=UPI0004F42602|nr:glycoprotein 96-92 [Trypanosoma grayi]KEG08126.1 glycoprotein 96-92 [Trypanosoma grayi]
MLLDRREYQALSTQLKSIMREACSEAPTGADRAAIEKRIAMLQCALDEVERRIQEKQLSAEVTRAQEMREHRLRREKQSESRMEAVKKDVQQRQKFTNELQEERRAYYSQRNEQLDAKIEMQKEVAVNAQAEIIERAEAENERRKRALGRLWEERARALKEHKEKSQHRMDHCREVMQRRKQLEEAKRREKTLALMQHEEELQQRQARSEHDQNEASRHHPKRLHRHGSSRSINSERSGHVRTLSQPRNHNALVKALREKEEQHRERYAAEQAVRQYELQQRAAARKEKQERQRRKYVEQLEERLRRGEEIIEMAHNKKHRGDRAKGQSEARDPQAGELVARDLEEHRRRAEAHELERRDDALQKKYRRWNERAVRVIQQLQGAIEAESANDQMDGRPQGFLPQLAAFRVT